MGSAQGCAPQCSGLQAPQRPFTHCRARTAPTRTRKLACRASASAATGSSFSRLEAAALALRQAPPSEKYAFSKDVLDAMVALKQEGALRLWGSASEEPIQARPLQLWELKRVGIKEPAAIGVSSIRDDRAFLVTVVGVTSVLAVAASFLPGDWVRFLLQRPGTWACRRRAVHQAALLLHLPLIITLCILLVRFQGFFVPYLTGGISIAVLAVGSTAPGLLEFAIGKFSALNPDYRERVTRHEAAHFLLGYLMGVPVGSYSLDLGRAHTDFIETKLQRRLIEGTLTDEEVNSLAVVAMGGAAAEAMHYPEVTGQNADMMDLQRLMMRGKTKLNNSQQQNLTRLAVYEAARLLRDNEAAYKALQEAMQGGAPVPDCIRAIENA